MAVRLDLPVRGPFAAHEVPDAARIDAALLDAIVERRAAYRQLRVPMAGGRGNHPAETRAAVPVRADAGGSPLSRVGTRISVVFSLCL